MDYARSFAHSDTILDFVKRPDIILRMITTFILMLIFSCILDKGYDSKGSCLYNANQGACNFTVGIAVIAFFVGLAFIAVTYFWDEITNIVTRKYIVFADLAFHAFWSFLYFVDFCFTADMWRKTAKEGLSGFAKSNLQFTVVMAFVCVFLMGAIAYHAFKQMQDMQNSETGLGGYAESGLAGAPGGGGYTSTFPPHTESAGGMYQSPFSS